MKITLKQTSQFLDKTSFKDALLNKDEKAEDYLYSDLLNIVNDYKNQIEKHNKIEKLNKEFNKIGIYNLKMNLNNICNDGIFMYNLELKVKQWENEVLVLVPVYYPYNGKSVDNINDKME